MKTRHRSDKLKRKPAPRRSESFLIYQSQPFLNFASVTIDKREVRLLSSPQTIILTCSYSTSLRFSILQKNYLTVSRTAEGTLLYPIVRYSTRLKLIYSNRLYSTSHPPAIFDSTLIIFYTKLRNHLAMLVLQCLYQQYKSTLA